MSKTSIAWTDMVWNPASGCTKVSAGCKNCYAERIAGRKLPGHDFDDRSFSNVRFHPKRLDAPLRWQKPRRVFVNSMSDLFHEKLTDEQIDQVFAVMALCPQHTFQILTKRPERMRVYCQALRDGKRFLGDALGDLGEDRIGTRLLVARAYGVKPGSDGKPPYRAFPNVWLGVSAENQATLEARWAILRETPAAVCFLSLEPLLEQVNLRRKTFDALGGPKGAPSWVIVGCESGPGRRNQDSYEEQARAVIEQCQAAGIPVFHKQMPVDGRVSNDPSEWPVDLVVQEWPACGKWEK
jgi:protein gp37